MWVSRSFHRRSDLPLSDSLFISLFFSSCDRAPTEPGNTRSYRPASKRDRLYVNRYTEIANVRQYRVHTNTYVYICGEVLSPLLFSREYWIRSYGCEERHTFFSRYFLPLYFYFYFFIFISFLFIFLTFFFVIQTSGSTLSMYVCVVEPSGSVASRGAGCVDQVASIRFETNIKISR